MLQIQCMSGLPEHGREIGIVAKQRLLPLLDTARDSVRSIRRLLVELDGRN